MKSIFAILVGVVIAYISWNFSTKNIVFTTLLFFGYFYINNRSTLFFLIISYYLFSSRGLLFGIKNYYDNFYIAIFLWLCAGIIITLVWTLIWSSSFKKRLYFFPIMLIVLISPPIGFISCVNPIISSGIFFPTFGFIGIVFYLLVLYVVTLLLYNQLNIVKFHLLVLMLILITLNYNEIVFLEDNNLYPINSNLVYSSKGIDFEGDYRRQKKLLSIANKSHYKDLLFCENALGNFTQNSMMIWDRLDNNKTVLAGGYIYHDRVGGYDNVLMEITNHSYKTIYRQRVPIPIAMWRPWIEQGARAYPFQNPTIKYKGDSVGVFICYEQLLTYTYLHTMLYNPKYIIGISNLWWVEDKSIGKTQKMSLELWGRLFGKFIVYSVNSPCFLDNSK